MKYQEDATYLVYSVSGDKLGELTFVDGYEQWPEGVEGWSHCMDCTVEPYDERSLKENLHFAEHLHREAIVVKAD